MKHLSTLFFIILLLAPLVLLAQDSEVGSEAPLSLWGMIRQGGWAMYPLGLCSLSMLFLIIHCWKETVRSKFIPQNSLDQVDKALRQGTIKDAQAKLAQMPSVLSRVMVQGLSRARESGSNQNLDKVEATLVEALEGEENALSQWINYLNVIAAVAPMIGLLGTVSGMIGAFQTISTSGMGRPELFAGNIGEALITTATGLVIGIPAMVFFFVMRNRLNNAMLAAVQAANALLDHLDERQAPGQ